MFKNPRKESKNVTLKRNHETKKKKILLIILDKRWVL